jgi:hypothetical protein
MLRSLIALAALLPLAACVDDGLETDASALGDGTPEAIGVLRFLNGPAADVATLDVAAALDARAAKNIVAHVRGADGLLGTGDDDPIADLAELDAIAQVGPATIDRLVAYVDSIGGIPRLTLEGVMLTQAEADAILAAARGATQAELDDAAALDARAATNIVAARPLADLAAVGAVPYVGATAIEKLRRWAPTWHGAPAPTCDPVVMQSLRECIDTAIAEQMIALPDAVGYCTPMPEYETCLDRFADEYATLCRADNDCVSPERCWGTPNDGSSVLGVCGTTAAETGEFDVDVPVAVSAAAGASATSVVVVRGLRTVPDVVSVEVDLDGVDARRVRLELTDANQGTSLLWDGATATSATLPGNLVPGPGIYYDDYVNGDWTLRVTTLGAGTAGTIASWRLRITSRWD